MPPHDLEYLLWELRHLALIFGTHSALIFLESQESSEEVVKDSKFLVEISELQFILAAELNDFSFQCLEAAKLIRLRRLLPGGVGFGCDFSLADKRPLLTPHHRLKERKGLKKAA